MTHEGGRAEDLEEMMEVRTQIDREMRSLDSTFGRKRACLDVLLDGCETWLTVILPCPCIHRKTFNNGDAASRCVPKTWRSAVCIISSLVDHMHVEKPVILYHIKRFAEAVISVPDAKAPHSGIR